MEEFVLEGLLGGFGGELRSPGRSGDDSEELEFGNGGAGNVDALGVRAGVGRSEEQAGVVDEGVEQGEVGGGQAFQDVPGAEGDAEPEAFAAGARQEGAAGEALGVDWIGEIEVADEVDNLDVVDRQGDNASAEVEEIDGLGVDEVSVGEIAGEGISGKTPDDDLFAGVGHGGLTFMGIVARCGVGRHEKALIAW